MLSEITDVDIKRILVIEDEPAICEICLYVLGEEGFRVDTVANNKLAEEKIRKEEYALILMDIKTPVMNGKELYQNIIDNFTEMVDRVIFITGDVMTEGTEAFIEKSGRPFLPKPYTPDELRKIVKYLESRLNYEIQERRVAMK